MIKDLSFNKVGKMYVSTPVQLQGDCGIHLELTSVKNGSMVSLSQSMTGSSYSSFKTEYYIGTIYDIAINGVIPGMFIRVQCNYEPVSGQILVKDE